jgi:hypothetical protein
MCTHSACTGWHVYSLGIYWMACMSTHSASTGWHVYSSSISRCAQIRMHKSECTNQNAHSSRNSTKASATLTEELQRQVQLMAWCHWHLMAYLLTRNLLDAGMSSHSASTEWHFYSLGIYWMTCLLTRHLLDLYVCSTCIYTECHKSAGAPISRCTYQPCNYLMTCLLARHLLDGMSTQLASTGWHVYSVCIY